MFLSAMYFAITSSVGCQNGSRSALSPASVTPKLASQLADKSAKTWWAVFRPLQQSTGRLLCGIDTKAHPAGGPASYPFGPSVIGYLTLPQPYVPAALLITFDDPLSTAPDLISLVNFITCGCVAYYGPASAGAAVVPAPPPCLSPVRPFSSRRWLRWWDS
jgi:hypothetical protein